MGIITELPTPHQQQQQQQQHQQGQQSLTTGELAKLCNVDRWQLLAAIRRGFIREPARVGIYRVWTSADVQRVVAALVAAGYLSGRGGSNQEKTLTPPTLGVRA